MNINTRFSSPVLGPQAKEVYSETYGEEASGFVDVLEPSPLEVGVVSRLMAFLHQKLMEATEGGVQNE